MLGAIAGDIIGSVHEFSGAPEFNFPLFPEGCHFTDDTILTIATAEVLLDGGFDDYAEAYRAAYRKHPEQAWGVRFEHWASSDATEPYESFGNGSAMRVSPVAWLRHTEKDLFEEAERSVVVTHNHPEGVRGALATALAIFMARNGESPEWIKGRIEAQFDYDLTSKTISELMDTHRYDETCTGTVPPALQVALEADDFESAVRWAVRLGGDADTLGCIAGSVAEARFGVPQPIRMECTQRLNDSMRDTLARFEAEVNARNP